MVNLKKCLNFYHIICVSNLSFIWLLILRDIFIMIYRPGKTRMRVEKWEFAREFSQLSCASQTRMRVDERWEARVCTRVLSTLMRRSNEVRVDESWEVRVCTREFSQLSCAVQTRWELMRVEKREFAREFSQLSCASQTRMRVDESWEARVCTRVLSTLMRRSNEVRSWWELTTLDVTQSLMFIPCVVAATRNEFHCKKS